MPLSSAQSTPHQPHGKGEQWMQDFLAIIRLRYVSPEREAALKKMEALESKRTGGQEDDCLRSASHQGLSAWIHAGE
jgi:hypothetical protein